MYRRSMVFLKVVVALAVFILLAPGVVQAAKPVRVGSISGYVTNRDNGNPIPDALVQVLDTSYYDYTSSTGYYYIGNVQKGTYSVRASATGFYNSDVSGIAVKTAPVSLDFELRPRPPPGYVSGHVYDSATGAVISGAYAYLRATNYAATSDFAGHFLIQSDPGLYTLKVTKAGYSEYVSPTSVTVVSYETTDVGGIYMDEAVLSLPMALQSASAVWTGNNALIFGGGGDYPNSYLNQVVKYDPSTDSSVVVQGVFNSGRRDTSAVWTGQYAYVFGGQNDDMLREVVRYNPADDSSTTFSNGLPTATYGTCAAWTGTFAYLFGGRVMSGDTVVPSVDIIRWDPVSNSATKLSATLPSGRLWSAAAFDGQYIYVIGGMLLYGDVTRQIVRFDPATNQATVLSAMLPLGMYGMVAVKDGGNILSLGGSTTGGPVDKVYELNLTTLQLNLRTTSLPLTLSSSCGINDGYTNYMFGGRTSGTVWPIDDITRYHSYDAARNYGVEPYNIFVGGLVNAANGNLVVQEEDISVRAKGFTISFVRSYNSMLASKYGPLGYGWTHNYNQSVKVVGHGDVIFTDACGSQHLFLRRSDDTYVTPPGSSDRLTLNASTSTFEIWSLDGSKNRFDSLGRLYEMADKNGNKLHLTYSYGYLVNITDDSGMYLEIGESNGRITSVKDPRGQKVTYYYYNLGASGKCMQMVSDVAPNSYLIPRLFLSYSEDAESYRCLSSMRYYVEDRWVEGFPYSPALICDQTNFTYDSDGRATQVWKSEVAEPLWPATLFPPIKKYSIEYTSRTLTTATCALGGVMSVTMSTEGLPTLVSGSPMAGTPGAGCTGGCGGSSLFPGKEGNEKVVLTWTSRFNVKSNQNGNGHTYFYDYDEYGNLVSVTDPTGNSESCEYEVVDEDARYISLLKSLEDELGYDTVYEYDSRGNTLKVTDPLGNYEQHSYDIYGNVLQTTNKRGYTTTNVYDSRGYLMSTTNALGYTTYYNYSITGLLEDVTSSLGYSTSATYNETFDAPETITYPDGGTVKIGRFPTGDISAYLDSSGNVTGYDMNVTLRVNDAVTDALGYTTRYYYNSMGFLIRVQDANGHSYNFTYDTYARLKTVTYPLGQVYELWYDHAGNVVTRRDAGGNETDYVYDALDRLVEAIYPDGQRMKWTHNAASQTTNVSGNGFWESTEYDGLGRVVEITTGYQFPDSTTTIRDYRTVETITYDPNSNALTDTFVAGSYSTVTTYSYDAIDRLTRVDSQSGLYWQFYYDADNRRTNLVAGPGGAGSYPYNISYAYDELGHVLSITTVTSPGIYKPPNSVYEYDVMGRMTSSLMGVGLSTEYAYDAVGQLISSYCPGDAGNEPYWVNFTYDGVGNRLSMVKKGTITGNTVTTGYTYDSNDRLTSSTDGYTYGYDANGNTVTASKVGDIRRMSYDYENRLVSVLDDGAEIARYKYSADGKLMVRSWQYGSGLIFLPDVYVYTHVTGLPTVALRYSEAYGWDYDVFFYSLNTDEALGMKYGYDDLEYFYFLDAMGNTRSVFKAKTNTPTTTYQTYTPFGVMSSLPTSELSLWARIPSFQGRIYDVASGAYNFRARDYNPSTGRFLQVDPQSSYGASSYAFVANDPLTKRDPTGEKWTWTCSLMAFMGGVGIILSLLGLTIKVQDIAAKFAYNLHVALTAVLPSAAWKGIAKSLFRTSIDIFKDIVMGYGILKKIKYLGKLASKLALGWWVVLATLLVKLTVLAYDLTKQGCFS